MLQSYSTTINEKNPYKKVVKNNHSLTWSNDRMAEIDLSCKIEHSASARTQRILERIHEVNTANK